MSRLTFHHPQENTMATAKPEVVEQAPEVKRVRVKAVHGDIVHAFTAQRFTTTDEDKTDLDTWVQIQLDAGKLELVKD